jgi:hypothetical protein
METPKGKAAASNTTKKCGSWIKRFICSRVARHLLCRKKLIKHSKYGEKCFNTTISNFITNHLKDTNEQISRLEKI